MCEGESPILNEVRRFMASSQGHTFLQGIRRHLKGRTIAEVSFAAADSGIATTLHLDKGETYEFKEEELSIEVLWEQFARLFRELDTRAHVAKKEE